MTEKTYTAVLDRFEEEEAVLLCEEGGEVVEELVIPKAFLPVEGRHQDAIFTLRVGEDDQTVLAYQPVETEERKKKAQSRFDSLSQSLSDRNPDDGK
ncbi:DUF3006 domain-containing protein [Haloarchaeobius amylolyticus]|uniref:DUF3006 domain-containing protein n=1 Tax=Haloarchaeobius amylolyticus TaxID=1198296 RepID=UPI0022710674|nr:DUF3006 domain-containing protein [Haloarchaeobius amylolyticus]